MKSHKLILTIQASGTPEKVEVTETSFVIGRLETARVRIADRQAISREHLKVDVKEGVIWVTDNGSSNGSFYKGKLLPAKSPHPITSGSEVILGSAERGAVIGFVLEVVNVAPTPVDAFAESKNDHTGLVVDRLSSIEKQVQETQDVLDSLDRTLKETELRQKNSEEICHKVEAKAEELRGFIESGHEELRKELLEKRELIQNSIDQAEERLKETHQEIESLQGKIKEKGIELGGIEARAKEMNEKLYEEHKSVSEKLKVENDELVASLKKVLQEKENEIEAEKKKLDETLEDKKIQIEDEKKKLHASLDDKKVEIEKAIQVVYQGLEDKKTEVDRLIKTHEKELYNKKIEIEVAIKSLDRDLDAKKADFERDVKLIEKDLERKQKEIDGQKEDLAKEVAKIESDLALSKRERDNADAQIEETRKRIAAEANVMEMQHDHLRKKIKADAEALESEERALKSKFEREAEEIKSKKAILERELKIVQDEKNQATAHVEEAKAEKKKIDDHVRVMKTSLDGFDTEVKQAEVKKIELEKEIRHFMKEQEAARESAKAKLLEDQKQFASEKENILQSFEKNKENVVSLTEKLEAQKVALEAEVAQIGARMEEANQAAAKIIELGKVQAQGIRAEGQAEVAKLTEACNRDIAVLKGQAKKEYDEATRAWKEEFRVTKEKDVQELHLLKAAEEKKVRDILQQDILQVSKHIATSALSPFVGKPSVDVATLMTSLEGSVQSAIVQQAADSQTFNPNRGVLVKKFKVNIAVGLVASVLLVLGIVYGPKMASDKIAQLKVENQASNKAFMEEARLQREKMLALHLEPRTEFQDNYIDNILYNTGYLSMKQDESLRKEWVAKLSKFFLDEMLLDERKVVEYVPLEAAMIRGLHETVQVLNAKNFEVNMVKMKEFQTHKLEEMWVMLGGRDQWLKLRKHEADFYAEHVQGEAPRIPASDGKSQ